MNIKAVSLLTITLAATVAYSADHADFSTEMGDIEAKRAGLATPEKILFQKEWLKYVWVSSEKGNALKESFSALSDGEKITLHSFFTEIESIKPYEAATCTITDPETNRQTTTAISLLCTLAPNKLQSTLNLYAQGKRLAEDMRYEFSEQIHAQVAHELFFKRLICFIEAHKETSLPLLRSLGIFRCAIPLAEKCCQPTAKTAVVYALSIPTSLKEPQVAQK